MSTKAIIWISVFVCGFLGGWITTLFGVSSFSFTGIIGSTIGGLFGIWIGYKIANF